MVDRNSVHWQELPDYVEGDDFYHFGYDSKLFAVSDVLFKDKFVTGNYKNDINFKLRNNILISQVFSFSKPTIKCNFVFMAKQSLALVWERWQMRRCLKMLLL